LRLVDTIQIPTQVLPPRKSAARKRSQMPPPPDAKALLKRLGAETVLRISYIGIHSTLMRLLGTALFARRDSKLFFFLQSFSLLICSFVSFRRLIEASLFTLSDALSLSLGS